MGIKYIRNVDDAMIVCRIASDKNKVFRFPAKKFDKRNNVIISNGFTEVSDEDVALLETESSVFTYYASKGKLILTDNLPHESMSTEQLIMALKSENSMLKKELKQIKDNGASMSLETSKAYMTKINELHAELTEKHKKYTEEIKKLKAELDEKTKTISALDVQLAEKKSNKNKATEKKED
jgi:NhaP-type Na+/H+ and K+/H+ antiporter